ncbi:MAG: S-layer homology domain-containing protein [Ruminococcaceae bacterium]|nr:S-layer homology domain-containing protein [Oscillospiraceae bacterium]
MKKFLSLMLAMIMVMSLVTVGAGAAFTDAADIENKEAVEVMNALGILQGSDGAFDPTGTLTRGAAAKIITYMLMGTEKAEAVKAAGLAEKPFPDVPTTSSTAPFIAYCAEKGIVNGYSDGTFQRSNPVSGNAFVKMVLVALGEKEIDFTAKGWQIEAIAKAEDMGLLEGISEDVVYSANLSRENAAQIAFNGMKYVGEGNKYYMVGEEKFDDATDAALYASLTQQTVVPKTDLTKSLAGKNYKLAVIEKVIVESTPETADQDYTVIGGKEYAIAASKDMVGHVVNVYYKDADGEGDYDFDAVEIEKSEKVYGLVALSEEVKVSSTKNGLKYAEVNALLGTKLDKAAADKIVAGTPIKTTYGVANYVKNDTTAPAVQYKVSPTYDGLTVNSGTYIIYDETVIAKKTTSNTVDIYTVAIDEDDYITVKKGDTVVYKTAEEEDDCVALISNEMDWAAMIEEDETEAEVVLTTKPTGVFLTVAEPKVITGKVTKIDTSGSTDYIYIDGTKYQGRTGETAEAKLLEVNAFVWDNTKYTYTTTYEFYLDASNKVFAYAPADGTVEGSVIVPVLLYNKYDYVAAKNDEYGQPDKDAKTTYAFWMQAVDMNGEIVNLQVSPTYEYVYGTEDDAVAGIKAHQAKYDTFTYETYNTYKTIIDAETGEAVAALTTTVDDEAVVKTFTGSNIYAADVKKITVDGKDFYVTDGFKTIYISETGTDLAITTKTGTIKQIKDGAVLYGEKADKADTAYVLKYVLINEKAATGVAGDELIYVKGALSTAVEVPYTDEDGKTQKGYNVTVYINGEKTTILVTAKTVAAVKAAGFYSYAVEKDGTYTLTEVTESVKVKKTLGGNYKGLLTVDGLVDFNANDAKIVNLLSSSSDYGYDDVPTSAAKLALEGKTDGIKTTISCIYDADEETISVIYVTAYGDQDK